jgi:hypothetical protein
MKNPVKVLFIIVISFFLVVISIASYLAFQISHIQPPLQNNTFFSCPTNSTVISFEIDDIIFSHADEFTLSNALYLSKKYNVTFDLGVIADSLQGDFDNLSFSLYKENPNSFEIIAHGWTHYLDPSINITNASHGEFYIFGVNKSVPFLIQEEHIKIMSQIFKNFNITTGDEIFTVPYHTGDFNTTLIAGDYGYKLILQKITTPQTFSEIKYGNGIVDSQVYVDIPEYNNFTSEDIINYSYQVNKAIQLGYKRIDISFHQINFQYLQNIDSFINEIINSQSNTSYKFLSERFNC